MCLLDWSLVKKSSDSWQRNAAFCQGLEAGLGLQVEEEENFDGQNVNQTIEQSSVDDDDYVDLLQELRSVAGQPEDAMDIDLDEDYISVSHNDLQGRHTAYNTSPLLVESEHRDNYDYRWTGM